MSISSDKAAIVKLVGGARDRRNAQTILDGLQTAVQMAAVTDLNQDVSASYVEAEVQAISDKVDELLAALRTAGLLAS